jgi:lipopolysaccharide heptosyltransferase II
VNTPTAADALVASGPPLHVMRGPTRHRRWRDVRRLLALRTDNLGDLLMTTPALAALREGLPRAHITLLGSPSGAAMAPHLPMVDEVWTCRPPWMPGCDDDGAAPGQAEQALVERLAAGNFDAAVIFTVCTQSALPAALVCRMAGIGQRLAHCRENPYALLTDWVPDRDVVADGMRHEVARQLALVAAIGCTTADDALRFPVSAADQRRARVRLAAEGVDGTRPFVLLHPGATAASRRWPAERFGRVAAAMAQCGWPAVLCGGADERALLSEARAAMAQQGAAPAPIVDGDLSLGELAALIDAAALLIANNSAPAHLAAALGTPVVDLYALTNPQHTPWRGRSRVLSHDVPCRWCLKSVCPEGHHACLRNVDEAAVVDAAQALLRESVHDDAAVPA